MHPRTLPADFRPFSSHSTDVRKKIGAVFLHFGDFENRKNSHPTTFRFAPTHLRVCFASLPPLPFPNTCVVFLSFCLLPSSRQCFHPRATRNQLDWKTEKIGESAFGILGKQGKIKLITSTFAPSTTTSQCNRRSMLPPPPTPDA